MSFLMHFQNPFFPDSFQELLNHRHSCFDSELKEFSFLQSYLFAILCRSKGKGKYHQRIRSLVLSGLNNYNTRAGTIWYYIDIGLYFHVDWLFMQRN